MTEKKPAARKEIGDVAMGYDDDAGNAGVVRTRKVTFDQPSQQLALEGGGTLAPFTLAYETYGTLSERKDNAVLVTHALSGDAHVAGLHSANDRRPGWWDMMIGPGKGVDTDRYFVVCSNVIGGCSGSTGPSSNNPSTGRPYGMDFPIVTIRDMVNAQMMLLDHLGIASCWPPSAARWAGCRCSGFESHPDRTHLCRRWPRRRASPPRPSRSTRSAARRSCRIRNGTAATTEGRRPARRPRHRPHGGHITYLSRREHGREVRPPPQGRRRHPAYTFDVQDSRWKATSATRARASSTGSTPIPTSTSPAPSTHFDLAAAHGSLEQAFAPVKARFSVAFSSDWLFPPDQTREIVLALPAPANARATTRSRATTATTPFCSSARRWKASSPRSWRAAPGPTRRSRRPADGEVGYAPCAASTTS